MPKFVKYFMTAAVFILGLSVGTYLGIEQELRPKTESVEKEIIPVQDVVIRNVQEKIDELKENDVIETAAEVIKLSPYAKMIIEKKFNRCGHTTVDVQTIPLELVNMTKEDIQEKYPDWEIRTFTSDEISLFREIEANCNDHFVLKEKDGFIAIYSNVTDDVLSLKEVTDIEISSLPEEDAKTLKDGILVYGEAALSSLIEDFSS